MTKEMQEELKKMNPKPVLGKKCLTPKQVAKLIGVSKNTVLNWARKTKRGELDMPLMSAPLKRALIFIPISEFVAWYEYQAQN